MAQLTDKRPSDRIWSNNLSKQEQGKSFVSYDLQTGDIAFIDTLKDVNLNAIQRELIA